MNLVIAPEVEAARGKGEPIVALESTIVAHGLPWPENFEIAKELEETVRSFGAIPATCAIIEGQPRVGLDVPTLERLAREGAQIAKATATDVAVHLVRKSSAATTVSATSMLAARAQIRTFATGGIGGVHRGDHGDVSHDLVSLARTPIAVVSAGAKAILDLPKTLETLETFGVLVIGYQTSELPAFYTRTSGLTLDHRADSITELATIARQHWDLGGGGILVCNPIPEEHELDRDMIGGVIEAAIKEAEARDVSGKRLTPFLLERLAMATGGASIRANRALAVHDARVAAELAVALAVAERAKR
ncbi:MAG: pseudouridine-5'-phosphate glycosidase [Kofleriaceae bacterium]|nr:pseudouridine-5'-phosphate glycosidase [Kofleriaceae bacterium]